MLAKLIKAFGFLRSDVNKIKESVSSLEKIRAIVRDGKPGKDGKSPDVKDIVAAVLAEIPTPKDGKTPDIKLVVAEVMAHLPKPRDGRDAIQINVSDVAAIVLAKIPKPRDGSDGPDLETVVHKVKSQIQDGKTGPKGLQGPPGKSGKDGVSVTDVQINNTNELIVFLDGKKKKAGTIRFPASLTPFIPGNAANAGGGGSLGHLAPVTPNRLKVINSRSQLPDAVDGLIPMQGGIHYLIGDDVQLGNDGLDVSAGGVIITGLGLQGPVLSYAGTADMVFGRNVGFSIFELAINCPNGQVYNFKSVTTPGSNVVFAKNIEYAAAKKLGTFDSLASLVMTESAAFELGDGISMKGSSTWRVVRIQNHGYFAATDTFIGIDLEDTVTEVMVLDDLLMNGPAGAIGIKGEPDSANVSVGEIADLTNANFFGGITPREGLDSNDIRWRYLGSNGIQDTMPGALLSLNGNVVKTTITDNNPTLVAGVWTCETASHFECDANGRIKYIGEQPLAVTIDCVGAFAPDANNTLKVYIALDGTEIESTGIPQDIRAIDPSEVSTIWRTILIKDQFLEIFIENSSGTDDITGTDVIFRVGG